MTDTLRGIGASPDQLSPSCCYEARDQVISWRLPGPHKRQQEPNYGENCKEQASFYRCSWIRKRNTTDRRNFCSTILKKWNWSTEEKGWKPVAGMFLGAKLSMMAHWLNYTITDSDMLPFQLFTWPSYSSQTALQIKFLFADRDLHRLWI